jgi:hypothetical protein
MTYELSSTSWGQEELDAMQRVLRSGRFTMGEQVRLFEDEFAARFGMKHAVMVNSGSSANLVGIAALFYRSKRPLQRGDEVIVPAISWATTFHPLQQYGLSFASSTSSSTRSTSTCLRSMPRSRRARVWSWPSASWATRRRWIASGISVTPTT